MYIEKKIWRIKEQRYFLKKLFESRLSDTITIIPSNPVSIIIIFIDFIFSLKKINAENAVIKGIELKVNRVFPLEVKANA